MEIVEEQVLIGRAAYRRGVRIEAGIRHIRKSIESRVVDDFVEQGGCVEEDDTCRESTPQSSVEVRRQRRSRGGPGRLSVRSEADVRQPGNEDVLSAGSPQ